jgi:hypothetical protein
MDTLTAFESDALGALLRGNDPALAILRCQAEVATVRSREHTAVGFFAEIAVPPTAVRPAGVPSFKLGDVFGTCDGLEGGFGLLLHVSEGLIHLLEGYAFEEHWPDVPTNVGFRYTDANGRDMDEVRSLIYKR